MNLHAHLLALEEQLLEPSTRANPLAVATLLADGFREFGSSGCVFDKEQTVTMLASEMPRRIAIREFVCEMLSADAALVTYRSDAEAGSALRSSLWVRRQDGWQMLFHQGTRLPARAGCEAVC